MSKFETKEEAKAALATAKEEKKAAKSELKAFEKENKLEVGGDNSGHEKFGKKWTKLNDAVQKKENRIATITEALAGFKKQSSGRASTYEYPADVVTAADKKKYRAKMRAAAKKEAKGEGEEKPKKSKKEKEGKEPKEGKSKKSKKSKSSPADEAGEED